MVLQPATEQKLMTAEEFWEMPRESDKRYELVRGVVVEKDKTMAGGTGGRHGVIEARLARYIGAFVEDNGLGFATGSSSAYILARNPDLIRIPDLGFVALDRMPRPVPSQFIPLAPDLAVEVVSPGDTASEVREKVSEYLKHGVRLIWVIYPELQTADVYTAPDQISSVSEEGTLSGGAVLPGFTLPLKTLFANLDA